MRLLIAMGFFLFGAAANASTVTLDLEEFNDGSWEYAVSAETQGFVFAGAPSQFGLGDLRGTGNSEIGTGPGGAFSLATSSQAAFSIESLDFYFIETNQLSVTGYLEGGGQVSVILPAEPPGAFNTYTFSSEWTGLTSIEVSGRGLYDNFVVTAAAVPVPAAVWLFGSGLAALGWLRRRS